VKLSGLEAPPVWFAGVVMASLPASPSHADGTRVELWSRWLGEIRQDR